MEYPNKIYVWFDPVSSQFEFAAQDQWAQLAKVGQPRRGNRAGATAPGQPRRGNRAGATGGRPLGQRHDDIWGG